MRTVTFADEGLADWLNENFVLVWWDARPAKEQTAEPGQLQPVYSKEELAAYPEGGGGANLRTAFFTPAGEYRHGLQGWWPAAVFREECERALELMKSPSVEGSIPALEAAVARLREEAQSLRDRHPEEFAKPIRESAIARRAAALDLRAREIQSLRGYAELSLVEMLLAFRQENEGVEFQ